MIEPTHLLQLVIRPVLRDLGLWSGAAEQLVLGTACQESQCGRYLVQLGGVKEGGLGIYQCEPATHEDIFVNFLANRPELEAKVCNLSVSKTYDDDLIGNLYYATAICRIHYLRDRAPIPSYLAAQAEYWKRVYNTEQGKGTVQQYMSNWNKFVVNSVFV